jgi:NADPH:quinone reductase-like Zn-dependent oxidoreductase
VQLAQSAGAHVVAPALPGDTDYLRELGGSDTLDRDSDLASQVRERFPDGVDAVLDLVSFTPDASVLKERGRLASPLGAAGEGPWLYDTVADRNAVSSATAYAILEWSFATRSPVAHENARHALDSTGAPLLVTGTGRSYNRPVPAGNDVQIGMSRADGEGF